VEVVDHAYTYTTPIDNDNMTFHIRNR